MRLFLLFLFCVTTAHAAPKQPELEVTQETRRLIISREPCFPDDTPEETLDNPDEVNAVHPHPRMTNEPFSDTLQSPMVSNGLHAQLDRIDQQNFAFIKENKMRKYTNNTDQCSAVIQENYNGGFYLSIYDLNSGQCIFEVFQDTLESAMHQAEKRSSFNKKAWIKSRLCVLFNNYCI